VFNRVESDVDINSVDSFVIKTIERESLIYSKLLFDVYFPDISSIIYASCNLDEEDSDYSIENNLSKASVKSSFKLHFLPLINGGLDLLNIIIMTFPLQFNCLPIEILQFASVLVIGLIFTIDDVNECLTPISNIGPNRAFISLVHIALTGLKISFEVLSWFIEITVKALMELTFLEEVECLKEFLKRGKRDLIIKTIKLFYDWIGVAKLGQLNTTTDSGRFGKCLFFESISTYFLTIESFF
jgi:hypothetical protein